MRPLFVAKVKYTKQSEDGSFKRVSEQFILEAMTFGHAEERVFEQLNHIRGEVVLDDLKRTSFHDMFLDSFLKQNNLYSFKQKLQLQHSQMIQQQQKLSLTSF